MNTTVIALIVLVVIYFIFYKTLNFNKISIKQILVIAFLINLSLIFIWNATSNDLFSYIHEARVFSVHSSNPYIIPFSNFPDDPLYKTLETVWSNKTSVYGPIFVLITSSMSFMAGNNFLLNILFFKTLFVFANILSTIFIYKITKSKSATYLYGFNPIILLELSINAHNEVFVILFLLIAIYFAKSINIKSHIISIFFITLSFLTKYTTIFLLPLFFIYLTIKQKTNSKKFLFLLLSLCISILTMSSSFFPFWDFRIFDRIILIANSNYLPKLTPIGHMLPYPKIIFSSIVLTVYITNSFKPKLIRSSIFVYATFLLILENLFLPWYSTPLIALLSLRKKSFFILFISIYATLQYKYILQ